MLDLRNEQNFAAELAKCQTSQEIQSLVQERGVQLGVASRDADGILHGTDERIEARPSGVVSPTDEVSEMASESGYVNRMNNAPQFQDPLRAMRTVQPAKPESLDALYERGVISTDEFLTRKALL
jgi:hypothetical protein